MSDLRDRVLEANPLDVLLRDYGVDIPPDRERVDVRCCLPGHEDQRPSMSVDLAKGLWNCHVCGRGGTAIDLVMAMEGMEFKGALHWLAERAGISDDHRSSGGANLQDRIEHSYDYRDKDSQLLFQVLRLKGKSFVQRRPDGNGGLIWDMKRVERVPYRLPELLANPDATVFIAEGEKDSDRLAALGLVATTNSGGAGKWRDGYSSHLKNRDVVILPDNDDPGRKHAQSVARSLIGKARSVKIVQLPDLPEKGDVSDWLDAGHTVEELLHLVDQQEPVSDGVPSERSSSEIDSQSGACERKRTQAERIIDLILKQEITLFHDEAGDAFVRLRVGTHYEILACRSKAFRQYLARVLWEAEAKVASMDATNTARQLLEAMARFGGTCHKLWNRVAFHDDCIWYDLADAEWRAVRIDLSSWEIVTDPPILFRRFQHHTAQIEPARGGDARRFLDFVNLRDEDDRLLSIVYLVSCFVPDIPHPMPDLHGGHGAAKSTYFRFMRRVCDPSYVELLAFPRKLEELVQQLSHHWCCYYDNISSLPEWVSDILCRAVTGEGFSKRELYTDDDDIIYKFRRCVGLNGINVVSRKPDLVDRSIQITLDPIPEALRRPESELHAEFNSALPQILGGVFDLLAIAMRIHPSVRVGTLPRMADFALWGCAISEALGENRDTFLNAYQRNARWRNDEILQSNPVAAAISIFMEERALGEWRGSSTDLLKELARAAVTHKLDTECRAWPKSASALTRRLNEVRSNLSMEGIRFDSIREGKARFIKLRRSSDNAVTTVIAVTEGANGHKSADSGLLIDDGILKELPMPSSVSSPHETAPGAGYDGCDDNDGICGRFTPYGSDIDDYDPFGE